MYEFFSALWWWSNFDSHGSNEFTGKNVFTLASFYDRTPRANYDADRKADELIKASAGCQWRLALLIKRSGKIYILLLSLKVLSPFLSAMRLIIRCNSISFPLTSLLYIHEQSISIPSLHDAHACAHSMEITANSHLWDCTIFIHEAMPHIVLLLCSSQIQLESTEEVEPFVCRCRQRDSYQTIPLSWLLRERRASNKK